MPFYSVSAMNPVSESEDDPAYLSTFNPDIRHAEGRSSTQANSGVAIPVERRGHDDPEILCVGSLCHSPVQGCKSLATGNIGSVQDQVLQGDSERKLAAAIQSRVQSGDKGLLAGKAGSSFEHRGLENCELSTCC